MNAEQAVWPESWPDPDDFFGDLQDRITSIHSRQLLTGAQLIIRFKNGYGANILHNRLEKGLSEIAFLKFFGSGVNDFDFIHERPLPDLSWCFSHGEIFNLCDSISKLGQDRNDMKRAGQPV